MIIRDIELTQGNMELVITLKVSYIDMEVDIVRYVEDTINRWVKKT